MKEEQKDVIDVIKKLPKYTALFYKLYRSKEVRRRHKLLLSLGFVYGALPVNLIPDIIPVAGQLDNLLMLLRSLQKTLSSIDKPVADRYMTETGITMEEIRQDIEITKGTLKSMGRGALKLTANTAKLAGYSAIYAKRKLWKKKPY